MLWILFSCVLLRLVISLPMHCAKADASSILPLRINRFLWRNIALVTDWSVSALTTPLVYEALHVGQLPQQCWQHRPPITAICSCLDKKKVNTSRRQRSFSAAGPCLWNSLCTAAVQSGCCFAPCINTLANLLRNDRGFFWIWNALRKIQENVNGSSICSFGAW